MPEQPRKRQQPAVMNFGVPARSQGSRGRCTHPADRRQWHRAALVLPCVTQRDHESISKTERPYVFVAIGVEFAAAADYTPEPVDEVVVQPEFKHLHVCGKERSARRCTHKRLLHATYNLGPA